MRVPPLTFDIMFESKPLTSEILVPGLAVPCPRAFAADERGLPRTRDRRRAPRARRRKKERTQSNKEEHKEHSNIYKLHAQTKRNKERPAPAAGEARGGGRRDSQGAEGR